jgi:hypothetical protein
MNKLLSVTLLFFAAISTCRAENPEKREILLKALRDPNVQKDLASVFVLPALVTYDEERILLTTDSLMGTNSEEAAESARIMRVKTVKINDNADPDKAVMKLVSGNTIVRITLRKTDSGRPTDDWRTRTITFRKKGKWLPYRFSIR